MQFTANSFSLKNTLESGQFFRYTEDNGRYHIISHGKMFSLEQKNNTIIHENADTIFVKRFLGVNRKYYEALTKLQQDSILAPVMKEIAGISILKQEPWECAAAFLCSQCSNIKRITKNVNDLAKNFGKKVVFEDHEGFVFPKPEEIDNDAKLKTCKLGYREQYFQRIKHFSINAESYEEAMNFLQQYAGVGEKIADCVCLFALGYTQAFPVDVWIRRAMKHLFGIEKPKEIKQFARKRWNTHAGYAQQYVYHWARSNL